MSKYDMPGSTPDPLDDADHRLEEALATLQRDNFLGPLQQVAETRGLVLRGLDGRTFPVIAVNFATDQVLDVERGGGKHPVRIPVDRVGRAFTLPPRRKINL